MGMFVEAAASTTGFQWFVPMGRLWTVHGVILWVPSESLATVGFVSYGIWFDVPVQGNGNNVFQVESPIASADKTMRLQKGIDLPDIILPSGATVNVGPLGEAGGGEMIAALLVED